LASRRDRSHSSLRVQHLAFGGLAVRALGLSSCSALAASRISHPGPVGGRRSATPHRRRHSRALADTESSQASLRVCVASHGRGRSVSILLTEASQNPDRQLHLFGIGPNTNTTSVCILRVRPCQIGGPGRPPPLARIQGRCCPVVEIWRPGDRGASSSASSRAGQSCPLPHRPLADVLIPIFATPSPSLSSPFSSLSQAVLDLERSQAPLKLPVRLRALDSGGCFTGYRCRAFMTSGPGKFSSPGCYAVSCCSQPKHPIVVHTPAGRVAAAPPSRSLFIWLVAVGWC
jgi:hypothetical protein